MAGSFNIRRMPGIKRAVALRPAARLVSGIAFLRECLRSPRAMGTVYPSSAFLARKMAEKIDPAGNGLVIELGAGTGCVTEAILKRGVSPSRMLIIERAHALVDVLKNRFPGLRILRGDAARLSSYLPASAQVDCIVSSLPFASLEAAKSGQIIAEIRKNIGNGRLIQYTYQLRGEHLLANSGFRRVSRSTVWLNIPPASVMEFALASD